MSDSVTTKKKRVLKRICARCKQEKEQVKDEMKQGANGQWTCGPCLDIEWEEIKAKMMGPQPRKMYSKYTPFDAAEEIARTAADMMGIKVTDEQVRELLSIVPCNKCGAKNRVNHNSGKKAICGRCKEEL